MRGESEAMTGPKQAAGMQKLGIYDEVNSEIGHIIVARVNADRVQGLLKSDRVDLESLIAKR